MKRKHILTAALAASLVVSGAAAASGAVKLPGKFFEAAQAAAAETAAAETAAAETGSGEAAAAVQPEALFGSMDGTVFGFMSGVGAWETTLSVKPDGSFAGLFYDANMGETGDGYENGTLYECSFTGRFGAVEQVSDKVFRTSVAELNYETQINGSDQYIDAEKTLHILAHPYGLSRNAEILVYLPGYPIAELSEEFMSWMLWKIPEDSTVLPEMAIYNATEQYVFYPDSYAESAFESASGSSSGNASESTNTAAQGDTSIYRMFADAYENQKMPDYAYTPYIGSPDPAPAAPWDSVTLENLQGRWVNRYTENGQAKVEVLTVNGDRARIESYTDGALASVWNGEGIASLEDRSAQNVSPYFRITDEATGNNICAIVIRWIHDDAFYDGLFLNEWKRESAEQPASQYLFDTVTLEALQGVWYSEYYENGEFWQDIVTVEGDQGTIFETKNGVPELRFWNGAGKVGLTVVEQLPDQYYPMLTLETATGPSSPGSIGIYISRVDGDKFYDAGFNRWFIRIPEN